jgi:hypothetical protein
MRKKTCLSSDDGGKNLLVLVRNYATKIFYHFTASRVGGERRRFLYANAILGCSRMSLIEIFASEFNPFIGSREAFFT